MMSLKRKVFALIILSFFFSATSFAENNFLKTDRLIRVGLVSDGKQSTFQLEPSNGFIEIFDNINKSSIYSGKATYVVVSYAKKDFFKVEIDGKKSFLNLKGEFLFSPIGKPPNNMKVKAPGKKAHSYRGSIALQLDGSKLFAINQVDIEDYLKSVVPCEIFNRAPASAMEAQAIAARTYAVRNQDRHRKKNSYDLCNTVHCQAYTGIVREIKATSAAVRNTEGRVLSFSNEPANTVYHSNCGGVLISSNAAWGGQQIPYLISHLDGIKGEDLFCNIGSKIKKSSANIKLPKPAKNLIVRSYPPKTKTKYHSNFGHRVGMCQDGAIGMGAIGYSYRQILGFYYPGTRLVTLNYARPGAPSDKEKPIQTIVKSEPIVLAMKPSPPTETVVPEVIPPAPLQVPLNPTQIGAIQPETPESGNKKSILDTLKELSAKRNAGKAGFRKVFWNPAQPDIFKSTSTN